MNENLFWATATVSLILGVALLSVSGLAYLRKHPQRAFVLPVYLLFGGLDFFFAYRFFSTGPGQVGSMFFLWWVFLSAISISTLWKTGRAVIQNRDFKEAGIF